MNKSIKIVILSSPKKATKVKEIINELEKKERGIYTGSIGMFTKDKANFNVAIRTLTVNKTIRDVK